MIIWDMGNPYRQKLDLGYFDERKGNQYVIEIFISCRR